MDTQLESRSSNITTYVYNETTLAKTKQNLPRLNVSDFNKSNNILRDSQFSIGYFVTNKNIYLYQRNQVVTEYLRYKTDFYSSVCEPFVSTTLHHKTWYATLKSTPVKSAKRNTI